MDHSNRTTVLNPILNSKCLKQKPKVESYNTRHSGGFVFIIAILLSVFIMFIIYNILRNYFSSQQQLYFLANATQQKHLAKEAIFRYLKRYQDNQYSDSHLESLINANSQTQSLCLHDHSIKTNCSFIDTKVFISIKLWQNAQGDSIQDTFSDGGLKHFFVVNIKSSVQSSEIPSYFVAIISLRIENDLVHLNLEQFWQDDV